jgi:DNA modification methylase
MIAEDLKALAVPIKKLKPLPGNPRRGDVEAVRRSYERFGQRKPIVAQRDGTVIAGNHQLKAAQLLGWSEMAVVWVDDDEQTAKAFALADNRTADLGHYDNEALAELLADVAVDPELLLATGYTEADLEALIGEIGELPPMTGDPDEVPETAPAKTVKGDVWLLGPHRLMCGDSTVPTDVERLMAGAKADMVWTDPPYGIAYKSMRQVGSGKIRNDDDQNLAGETITLALSLAGQPRVVFACCDWRSLQMMIDSMKSSGFEPKSTLVWDKGHQVQNLDRFGKSYELIVYAGPYGGEPTFSRDVWECPRDYKPDHPTPKPVELVEKALESSSDLGDLVYDCFAGSGSAIIAAHGLGRIAYLMELDEQYCDIICARFQKATGITPINEATKREHSFID